MLTLKKGAYTLDELKILVRAVHVAFMEIECDGDCDTCKAKHPCDDLCKLEAHIRREIDKETRKTRDNES